MRHLKAGKRLGVTTSHRRAMMRNMVTSILEHGEIHCTLTRAKESRKYLDKMITLGKRGDLHARRQALGFVKSKAAMSQLFGDLADRYTDRSGGYSRIIKLGKRRLGDGAEMVILQLLGSEKDVLSELKGKKRSTPKVEKTSLLQEVSDAVVVETATATPSEENTEAETTSDSTVEAVSEESSEENTSEETSTETPTSKE